MSLPHFVVILHLMAYSTKPVHKLYSTELAALETTDRISQEIDAKRIFLHVFGLI